MTEQITFSNVIHGITGNGISMREFDVNETQITRGSTHLDVSRTGSGSVGWIQGLGQKLFKNKYGNGQLHWDIELYDDNKYPFPTNNVNDAKDLVFIKSAEHMYPAEEYADLDEEFGNLYNVRFGASMDQFTIFGCCNENDHLKYKIIESNLHSNIDFSNNKLNHIDLLLDQSLINDINENYICSICFDLIYPCITLKCGHNFCKTCIDKYCISNRNNDNKCAFCRAVFSDYSSNLKINNLLGNLISKCPNENCDWKGNISKLNDHINEKNTTYVMCKWCNLPMEIKLFNNHIKNDCEYRQIKCNFCDITGPYCHFKYHKSIYCKKCPKRCWHCHQLFDRNIVHDHMTKCNNKLVPCEYCKKYFKLNQINGHKLFLCENAPIKCEKCKCEIQKKFYEDHNKKYHSIKLMNFNEIRDQIFCKNPLIRCEKCTCEIPKKFYKDHNKKYHDIKLKRYKKFNKKF